MFSCELCEIFKNTFFYRAPPVAASVTIWKLFFRLYALEKKADLLAMSVLDAATQIAVLKLRRISQNFQNKNQVSFVN